MAQAGLTPTGAIRALWEYARDHAGSPVDILELLHPERAHVEQDTRETERRRRAEAIDRGPLIVRQAYETAGMPWPSHAACPTYDELEEQAYHEHYSEMMGWER